MSGMPLDQAISYRMAQFAADYDSGLTELTGKAIREGGTEGAFVGRYGGIKPYYPELSGLKAGPKAIAAAIKRGKGKVFAQVYANVRSAMIKEGYKQPRKRKPGRPVIPPHEAKRVCKTCHEMHSKSSHRFHGEGSYHATHLFSFGGKNPMRKTAIVKKNPLTTWTIRATTRKAALKALEKEMVGTWYQVRSVKKTGPDTYLVTIDTFERRNPRRLKVRRVIRRHRRRVARRASRPNPPGLTKIYGRVLAVHIKNGRVMRIEAQKTQAHRCDAECKSVGHRYYHDFKKPPAIYGTADHKRLIIQ